MSRELSAHWLAMRLGAMGDVLLATGVLEYWRKTRGLRFSFLTKAPWGELLQGHPAVERVVELGPGELGSNSFRKRARELASEFEGAGLLDLHGTMRSRLLSLLWKGEVRRYSKFSLTRRVAGLTRWPALLERLEALSVPQRYALALESEAPPSAELAPRIWLEKEELARARTFLEERLPAAKGARVAALHPFAAHENKRWPDRHWSGLRDRLLSDGWCVFTMGRGRLHEELAPKRDQQAQYTADFAGGTSPRQSAALLACADVLVTGDSGPMHLATAVGTPVVALFGPTTRAWGFFPLGRPRHGRNVVLERELPCRPCSLHGRGSCGRGLECLAGIAPEVAERAVYEAAGQRKQKDIITIP